MAFPKSGRSTMQNSGPGARPTRRTLHTVRCSQPQSSIPTSRRRPFLPLRTSSAPRLGSRSPSASSSASWIRSPARQSTTISPRTRKPLAPSLAVRMTATISSTRGGSAGYRRPLFLGDRPRWNSENVAGERRRPATSTASSVDTRTSLVNGQNGDCSTARPAERRRGFGFFCGGTRLNVRPRVGRRSEHHPEDLNR